jgi:hypothetical protein
MKTAAKILLGIVGVGIVGTVVVLATSRTPPGGTQATPPPPGRYPTAPPRPRDSAGMPVRPSSETTGLPFNVWKQSTGNLLEITDARALLTWVLATAKDLDIGALTSAKDAVKKIAKEIASGGINRVAFEQLPDFGMIPFDEIASFAKNIPWGTIGPIAKAWMSARGIG